MRLSGSYLSNPWLPVSRSTVSIWGHIQNGRRSWIFSWTWGLHATGRRLWCGAVKRLWYGQGKPPICEVFGWPSVLLTSLFKCSGFLLLRYGHPAIRFHRCAFNESTNRPGDEERITLWWRPWLCCQVGTKWGCLGPFKRWCRKLCKDGTILCSCPSFCRTVQKTCGLLTSWIGSRSLPSHYCSIHRD